MRNIRDSRYIFLQPEVGSSLPAAPLEPRRSTSTPAHADRNYTYMYLLMKSKNSTAAGSLSSGEASIFLGFTNDFSTK